MYIPGTTCLHILLAHPCLYYYLLSPQYTAFYFIAHFTPYFFLFLFYFFTYIYIYSLVLGFIFLHCSLSGPVLIYISLLIISCIIEYVTNKRTLNLARRKSRVRSNNAQTRNVYVTLVYLLLFAVALLCCDMQYS